MASFWCCWSTAAPTWMILLSASSSTSTTRVDGLVLPLIVPATTTKTNLPRPLGRSVIARGGKLIERKKRLALLASSSSNTNTDDSTNDEAKAAISKARPPIDFVAIGKYGAALAIQMSLIFGLFTGIDFLLAKYATIKVPFAVNFIFFYFFNLKTSIFSPLPNKKEGDTSDWEYTRRNQPSWTPPGLVFAFMWPVFVFGIRAATAAQIVRLSGGVYASPAIFSLLLHLVVGTLWNTV